MLMGWARAPGRALEDNLPALGLDPRVLSVYVDNFATIGTSAAHVKEVGNAVLGGAHAVGLEDARLVL